MEGASWQFTGFHAVVNSRRQNNFIDCLPNGNREVRGAELHEHVMHFYQHLFSTEVVGNRDHDLSFLPTNVNTAMNGV